MRLATRSSFISCSIALRDVSNQTQQATRVTRESLERRKRERQRGRAARTQGTSRADPYARQARPGQLCALFTFRIARCFYSITSGKFCHFVQCLQVAAMCPCQLLAAFILFCYLRLNFFNCLEAIKSLSSVSKSHQCYLLCQPLTFVEQC